MRAERRESKEVSSEGAKRINTGYRNADVAHWARRGGTGHAARECEGMRGGRERTSARVRARVVMGSKRSGGEKASA